MTERVRLGIIGTGIAARDLHWPPLKNLSDRFEIVALANRTLSRAQDFARIVGGNPRITTDYHELLAWPEVDAVDVITPIALNASVAIDALHAGKHVIMEKPVGAGVEDGKQVVREARRHPKQVLLVAENVRYAPDLLHARRLMQAGTIGRPMLVRVSHVSALSPESPYTGTQWRRVPAHLGGYLSDGGVHEAAKVHMLGGAVSAVQGMIVGIHPERQPEDTLVATLRFASGALGTLTLSFGVVHDEDHPVRVDGTEGALVIHYDRIEVITGAGASTETVDRTVGSYEGEFRDFYEAITQGKRPASTPEEALADLALIDAVFRSSAEGRAIAPFRL